MMELKIDEPISSSALLKSHHNYHESSGYSSKDAECSSPENKSHSQHRYHETKLRITGNNNNNNNSHRTADTHRRRHKLPASPTTTLNSGSMIVDDSLKDTNDTEEKVRNRLKSFYLIRT